MIFKDYPKRDVIITLFICAIGLIIILFAILPFLGIQSIFLKALIIICALVVCGYPIWKALFKRYQKSVYERKHGRKLN